MGDFAGKYLSRVWDSATDRLKVVSKPAETGNTLAAVTNGVDATYYYYLDMDGYNYVGLQLELDGGGGTCTVSMEASCQDDGTAQGTCAYQDVTLGLTGVANATADALWLIDRPLPVKYLRVKVVAATGGANSADWTIYAIRKS